MEITITKYVQKYISQEETIIVSSSLFWYCI